MSSPLAEAFLLVTLNNCYETPSKSREPVIVMKRLPPICWSMIFATWLSITVLFWIVDFLVEPFVTLLSALFESGCDAGEKLVCVGVTPIVHYACYLFTPVRGIELFVLFSADGG